MEQTPTKPATSLLPIDTSKKTAPPIGPSYATAEDAPRSKQAPVDEVEEASMESFPASDPPSFGAGHV